MPNAGSPWRRRKAALSVLLFALLFSGFTKVLGKLSGIGTTAASVRTELPLLVIVYAGLYFIVRESRYRACIAALPLVVIYLAHDLYYSLYGNVFRLADISEVPELLDVLTTFEAGLYGTVLVVPLILFLASIQWTKGVSVLVLLVLLWLSPLVHSGLNAAVLGSVGQFGSITEWSDQYSVRDSGRLTMILYHEAERRRVTSQLASFRDNGQYRAVIDARTSMLHKHSTGRSVHVVVLESFLDPLLLRNVHYSKPPVHPDFAALFAGTQGLSVSPVFGGKSCQAEFELLCGVPAFGSLGSVEFNVLAGRGIRCLPALLRDAGYRTIASNAYKPDFFNTLPAYRSLGFEEIYFPKEYAPKRETYLSTGDVADETFVFDGALLSQNLSFVGGKPDQVRPPLFNYVLGIYGRHPHRMNEELRPHVIDVYGAEGASDRLTSFVNQYYYRTGAVAEYVTQLIARDRNALIIVVSDHLPPLAGGPRVYERLGYLAGAERAVFRNSIYVVENGVPTRYTGIAHYDLPDLVLNYITDGEHCRSNACNLAGQKHAKESYFQAYMGLLAEELR